MCYLLLEAILYRGREMIAVYNVSKNEYDCDKCYIPALKGDFEKNHTGIKSQSEVK